MTNEKPPENQSTPGTNADISGKPIPTESGSKELRPKLKEIFGADAAFAPESDPPRITIKPESLRETATRLRESGFDYLLLLTAVDYPDEGKIQIVYAITNFNEADELTLTVDLDRNAPEIDTVSDIWRTADWHEREVFDLFAVRFRNHPDLRRILLDDNWEGYPLRKDYVDNVHNVVKRHG
ncbi:MAG: NADH-quinone oxidoreductase subunit C [Verrucomicrobia bacterium]|nr:NADH-quinone oxidoreductase subunit C [Verrucomicrobiota bacterium]MCF7708366.1 NADH-quinone oxidoreductase subunit C [Verrucomicrobiota bacterium]